MTEFNQEKNGDSSPTKYEIPTEQGISPLKDRNEPWQLAVVARPKLDTLPTAHQSFAYGQDDYGIYFEIPEPPVSTKAVTAEAPTKNDIDPWSIPDLSPEKTKNWSELTSKEKGWTVCKCILKAILLLLLLYLFVYSLDILSTSFRLLGGKTAGSVFRNSKLLRNPVFGLMIGILATVLVQSSSTSTSIVVSMVASEILAVRAAIPIIMGANIGTSMTNTLVSVAHSGDRAQFRRAFAGATVHDMFNWLTVIIVLPIEVASGYLYHLTTAIIHSLNLKDTNVRPPQLLAVLTKPLTGLTIQLDESVLEKLASGELNSSDASSLVKRVCSGRPCRHIFTSFNISDMTIGIILLISSLAILMGCLVCIVKLLSSVLRGRVVNIVHRTVNAELPGRWGFLTGYLAILVGALMTILVQSSSVFTSALTPLVGLGVLSVERMYPMTLGSNVGTTFTSVLAALASPPRTMPSALQIALCHLFFNLSGILLFYPVPCTRRIPITLAKLMGEITGQYRWFAIVYVLLAFCLLPGAIFGLSLLGDVVLISVGVPVIVLVSIIILVNVLQRKCPTILPGRIRTWEWLPEWMHSLEPYDRLITSCLSIRYCECCCPKVPVNTAPSTSLASSESRRVLVNIGDGNSRAESPVKYVASRLSIVELANATVDGKGGRF